MTFSYICIMYFHHIHSLLASLVLCLPPFPTKLFYLSSQSLIFFRILFLIDFFKPVSFIRVFCRDKYFIPLATPQKKISQAGMKPSPFHDCVLLVPILSYSAGNYTRCECQSAASLLCPKVSLPHLSSTSMALTHPIPPHSLMFPELWRR